MQDNVIWVCLIYSCISLVVFWGITYFQSDDKKDAKQVVKDATAKGVTTDNPSEVLEKAAKLVEAFTKAGPAIASLGASIAALGFAAYIVAQPPKDQDKAKTGTGSTSQSTPTPAPT